MRDSAKQAYTQPTDAARFEINGTSAAIFNAGGRLVVPLSHVAHALGVSRAALRGAWGSFWAKAAAVGEVPAFVVPEGFCALSVDAAVGTGGPPVGRCLEPAAIVAALRERGKKADERGAAVFEGVTDEAFSAVLGGLERVATAAFAAAFPNASFQDYADYIQQNGLSEPEQRQLRLGYNRRQHEHEARRRVARQRHRAHRAAFEDEGEEPEPTCYSPCIGQMHPEYGQPLTATTKAGQTYTALSLQYLDRFPDISFVFKRVFGQDWEIKLSDKFEAEDMKIWWRQYATFHTY